MKFFFGEPERNAFYFQDLHHINARYVQVILFFLRRKLGAYLARKIFREYLCDHLYICNLCHSLTWYWSVSINPFPALAGRRCCVTFCPPCEQKWAFDHRFYESPQKMCEEYDYFRGVWNFIVFDSEKGLFAVREREIVITKDHFYPFSPNFVVPSHFRLDQVLNK